MGTRGGSKETEKIFTSCRECASPQRGVPGKDGVIRGLEKMVRLGTYKIRSIRNEGLESALHGLVQGQVDCGVLKEIKLNHRFYMLE